MDPCRLRQPTHNMINVDVGRLCQLSDSSAAASFSYLGLEIALYKMHRVHDKPPHKLSASLSESRQDSWLTLGRQNETMCLSWLLVMMCADLLSAKIMVCAAEVGPEQGESLADPAHHALTCCF